MIYRCRRCNHEEARGCLPAAGCGFLALVPAAAAFGLALGALRAAFPDGLGWWWALALPGLVVVAFAGSALGNAALAGAEWLAFCRRTCPRCGARRWSRGFTRGFGL